MAAICCTVDGWKMFVENRKEKAEERESGTEGAIETPSCQHTSVTGRAKGLCCGQQQTRDLDVRVYRRALSVKKRMDLGQVINWLNTEVRTTLTTVFVGFIKFSSALFCFFFEHFLIIFSISTKRCQQYTTNDRKKGLKKPTSHVESKIVFISILDYMDS